MLYNNDALLRDLNCTASFGGGGGGGSRNDNNVVTHSQTPTSMDSMSTYNNMADNQAEGFVGGTPHAEPTVGGGGTVQPYLEVKEYLT